MFSECCKCYFRGPISKIFRGGMPPAPPRILVPSARAPQYFMKCPPLDERYARCLNDVVQSFDAAATGAGKVHWLQQFPQFNFAVSSTVDIWGCEQDMFVPCLALVTVNTLKTTCTSKDCPKQIQELNQSSVQILNGNVEDIQNQTYLETLFYNWLCPPPIPCDVQFQHQPPPTAPMKTGHSSLLFLAISGMNLCVVEASVHLTLESLQMVTMGFTNFPWRSWTDRQT